jgi:predicted RNA methylase
MAVAKALGARRVIAVDIQQDRLDFAKSYAATDIYLPVIFLPFHPFLFPTKRVRPLEQILTNSPLRTRMKTQTITAPESLTLFAPISISQLWDLVRLT